MWLLLVIIDQDFEDKSLNNGLLEMVTWRLLLLALNVRCALYKEP